MLAGGLRTEPGRVAAEPISESPIPSVNILRFCGSVQPPTL
jgi:hypothetical protein